MKLWEYLKTKMKRYSERVAFAGLGLTYAELLQFSASENKRKRLVACEGNTREEQALAILKCIAQGDVVVPITKEYGERQYAHIQNILQKQPQDIEDVAFIMFTSGTTGIPKGVMLTEENIIVNLQYIHSYFRLENVKRICIARPLVHIAVLTGELLYALCNGLTIYFYEEPFMPPRLLSYFIKNEIDVFCATPTLYHAIAGSYKGQASPLKIGVMSGELLTKNTQGLIVKAFPDVAWYNVYGLTEHAPRISALCPFDFSRKVGSVGKVINGIEWRIVDGELLVKSPCVMKGYYLDEEKTREKIQDGWLYTGDRAHFDEEGYLYIDGRKDSMLIRAGLNIYPEEIEAVVKEEEGVEDCIVEGVSTEQGIQIVLKYVGIVEASILRKRLIRLLNPHILPNKIEKVGVLARTVSGKKIRNGK